MSHSLSPITIDDVPRLVTTPPFRASKTAKGILWFLLVVGLATFIMGVAGPEPQLAWIAYHTNLVFWVVLAAAGTAFSAIFQLCNAQWARPVWRIFESNVNFLCISLALLGLFYIGHGHVFVWAHEPVPGRGEWLTSTFLFLRDILALAVLVFLSYQVVFYNLRKDFIAVRSGLTAVDPAQRRHWDDDSLNYLVAGANLNDPRRAIQDCEDRMWRLSPLVIIAYAIVISLLAFDLVMSVDPAWYSTLFGAMIFMSGIYAACAYAGITLGFMREAHPIFRAKIERRTLHDLGKLVLGFGIFWAYMFWSHYLPIWYGNMPEETHWVILRLREEPWHSFAWVVFGATWIIPFLLGLSRDVKQMPTLHFCTGVIVVCGVWMQTYLFITPSLYPNVIPLSLNDVLITAGFLGGFALSQIAFLEKFPAAPFGDFYREEPQQALRHAA